jgi:hypothetical protein
LPSSRHPAWAGCARRPFCAACPAWDRSAFWELVVAVDLTSVGWRWAWACWVICWATCLVTCSANVWVTCGRLRISYRRK